MVCSRNLPLGSAVACPSARPSRNVAAQAQDQAREMRPSATANQRRSGSRLPGQTAGGTVFSAGAVSATWREAPMRLGLATGLGVLFLVVCGGGCTTGCPTPLCGGIFCCAKDAVCVAGQCTGGSCPPRPLCEGTCCPKGTVCFPDFDGGSYCATVCTDGSGCPSEAPCCGGLFNPDSGLYPYGYCAPYSADRFCLCNSASECRSGCCAPANGDPVNRYVCEDDLAYIVCCNDGGACTGTCCMTDANGSDICVKQCIDDSTCGAAHCVNYVGPAAGSTCVGNMGCGP
jgi:hypothetical protein